MSFTGDIISSPKRNVPTPATSENKKREKRAKGIEHLDRFEWVVRIFAGLAVVSLILSVVLLALAQGEYVSPLYSLYSFSTFVGSLIILKCIDCCQQALATHFDL